MAARGEKSSKVLHNELITFIGRRLSPALKDDFRSFVTNLGSHLPKAIIAENKGSTAELLAAMETENLISVGNYKVLLTVFDSSYLLNLKSDVELKISNIEKELESENHQQVVSRSQQQSESENQPAADPYQPKVKQSEVLHSVLLNYIEEELIPEMPEYELFTNAARPYVSRADLTRSKKAGDILEAMRRKGYLAVGNYSNLIQLLETAKLNDLLKGVNERVNIIAEKLKGEGGR